MLAIRYLEKDDIPEILAIEHDTHVYDDPDFQISLLPEYAWTESEILAAVRQYRSHSKGSGETRAYAVEMPVEFMDAGQLVQTECVCGGFIYELSKEEYEILFFCCHPNAPETRQEMLNFVLGKAELSETRKRVSMYVPDGDYQLLKFFQDNDFVVTLKCNPKGNDSWHCVYQIKEESDEMRPMAA